MFHFSEKYELPDDDHPMISEDIVERNDTRRRQLRDDHKQDGQTRMVENTFEENAMVDPITHTVISRDRVARMPLIEYARRPTPTTSAEFMIAERFQSYDRSRCPNNSDGPLEVGLFHPSILRPPCSSGSSSSSSSISHLPV